MKILSNTTGELVLEGIHDTIAPEAKPGFLLGYKGYNYYYIDLKASPADTISNIIDSCELLERQCWNPQSNFREYIKKCHHLMYAEYDNEIIGFQLSSFPVYGSDLVVSLDEIMIRKEHHKGKVGLKIGCIAFTIGSMLAAENPDITHVIWLGISCNPRIITSCFRGDPLTNHFPNTFNPNSSLLDFHRLYIESNGYERVHEDYDFFLKNVFPSSNKLANNIEDKTYPEKLQQIIPPGFDCMERGDAFMYAVRFGKRVNRFIIMMMMLKNFTFSLLYRRIGSKLYNAVIRKTKPLHRELTRLNIKTENNLA
jgi:hypothetical protein